jgi:hypothetical protein
MKWCDSQETTYHPAVIPRFRNLTKIDHKVQHGLAGSISLERHGLDNALVKFMNSHREPSPAIAVEGQHTEEQEGGDSE